MGTQHRRICRCDVPRGRRVSVGSDPSRPPENRPCHRGDCAERSRRPTQHVTGFGHLRSSRRTKPRAPHRGVMKGRLIRQFDFPLCSKQQEPRPPDVRYGSKADMSLTNVNVRFAPLIGRTTRAYVMSAKCQKRTSVACFGYVRDPRTPKLVVEVRTTTSRAVAATAPSSCAFVPTRPPRQCNFEQIEPAMLTTSLEHLLK